MIFDILLVVLSAVVTATVREIFAYVARSKESASEATAPPPLDYVVVARCDDGTIRLSFGDANEEANRWLSAEQAKFVSDEIAAVLERMAEAE